MPGATPMVGAESGSVLNHLGSIYKSGNGQNLNRQIRAQMNTSSAKTFAFMSFMFLGVLSVAYIVSFKNYHASLEKL
jgi:nitrate reductase NapE component